MSILLTLLSETSQPAFKRTDNQITRYFRCTSGPKAGKLASDPSKCGVRPNPKRVRHGRKVARERAAIRIRKTELAKRQHVSKRISQMNRDIAKRMSSNANHRVSEFDTNILNLRNMINIQHLTETSLDQLIALLQQSFNQQIMICENGIASTDNQMLFEFV